MDGENVTSTCDTVVDYVIDQVSNCSFNPGDKLLPERELAKQLNVSRAAVREAIKALSYLGFVDSAQGSGNYITDKYDKTTARIMHVMYKRGVVSFDDLTSFRQMLELQAFDLGLIHATKQQKEEMKSIISLMDITLDSNLIFELDNRFHMLLAESSNNSLIIINFIALENVITEYMMNTYRQTVSKKKNGYESLQQYHHQIVDALIENDKEKGHEAIANHYAILY